MQLFSTPLVLDSQPQRNLKKVLKLDHLKGLSIHHDSTRFLQCRVMKLKNSLKMNQRDHKSHHTQIKKKGPLYFFQKDSLPILHLKQDQRIKQAPLKDRSFRRLSIVSQQMIIHSKDLFQKKLTLRMDSLLDGQEKDKFLPIAESAALTI